MSVYVRRKAIIAEEKYLNWAEISKYLTNGSDRIRKNRIPETHKPRIEELLKYIREWEAGKKLYSVADLTQALDETDLKTILCTKMGIKTP